MTRLLTQIALVIVAASVAFAARDLKQLGGILGGLGLGSIDLPAIPLLPTLPITLGSVGFVAQILDAAATIELLPPAQGTFAPNADTNKTGPFLYVWNAYGKSFTDPIISTSNTDFLVAIDLNKYSSSYGKIVHLEKLPNTGNEPHHISISYDRKRLLGGGLLSFLRGQNDVFLFDIGVNPATPKLLKSSQLLLTAVTDHAFGLKNGLFLTTQMGSKVGGTPGGISLWDNNLKLNGTYPDNPPTGFNPHGADVNSALDLLLTTDFILPVSTVTAQVFSLVPQLIPQIKLSDVVALSDYVLRDTVRVWKLSNLKTIQNTITLPGGKGIIDVKIIPGVNPKGLAFATGVFDGNLFLVDPVAGTAKSVLFFGPDIHPHLLAAANPQGTRFFLTLNKAGYFLYLDTTDPNNVKVLDSLYLGEGASPHYIQPLGKGDNRVAVADYFLDQGLIGKVHAGGNKKVFIVPFNATHLDGAKTFAYDFKKLNGRPHGIATNLQYTDVEA